MLPQGFGAPRNAAGLCGAFPLDMPEDNEPKAQPDWHGIAEMHRFHIPSDELDQVVAVLSPLVADCRRAFGEDLGLEEPIGTFRPERT